jgi:hypothetical protein
MQSDERVRAALAALKPEITQYRFVVSSTLERAQALLASESAPAMTGTVLGQFASGRIDPEKFALISSGTAPLDAVGRAMLERAMETLNSLLDSGDNLFAMSIARGSSVAGAIRDRISTFGSAFGAAAIIELVRRRTYDPALHGLSVQDQPFESWTPSERRLVPPLVVRVDGSNVDPYALGSLVDGRLRLVLLVDGSSSPSLLARLVSPGVFVAQTSDVSVLDTLKDLEAPAVVAVMSGAEARFIHDPRGGWASWQRMKILSLPDSPIRKAIGWRSAWQQREDIAYLRSLADLPALKPNGDVTRPTGLKGDPTERLTEWLLEQSSVAGVS